MPADLWATQLKALPPATILLLNCETFYAAALACYSLPKIKGSINPQILIKYKHQLAKISLSPSVEFNFYL